MSSTLGLRLKFENLRSLEFGSIGAAYMGVGTSIENPARQWIIENLTDAAMIFSFDGVNDHFVLPSNGMFIEDITSNKSVSNGFFLSVGERLYVRQESGAPTSGSVYFSVIYADEG